MRSEFADRGVVCVPRAFTEDDALRIRDVVWGYASRRIGMRRDAPASWPTGWVPISWKGLKRHRALDVLWDNGGVAAALDAIFGAGGWRRPHSGPQILITVPSAGPWAMPVGWHMDCGFEQPTWPVPAVKAFGFFGDVGPCGGGTLVLAGSHRLVDAYRATFDEPPAGGTPNWQRFLRRHPPLAELLTASAGPDGGRSLVGTSVDIDGVPVELVELVGRPGDVVITHLHVFHCASPNTAGGPREMIAKGIVAAGTDPRPTAPRQ